MTSLPSAAKEKTPYKVWEDAPDTFTAFGALDSEVKPKGLFSRLWKRGKYEDGQSSSRSASPSESIDKASASPNSQSLKAVTESSTPASTLSSEHGSKASLADMDPAFRESPEGTEDQRHSHVFPHRTLNSVLNRLSSILDQRSTTPQTYKDSDFKQYWMPDHTCRECYDCGDKFTTFKRRHHCRICGQIFCSKCCNQELPGKIIGYKGGIRVCTYCCKVVQKYAQDKGALEDLRAISEMSESGSFDFGNRSMSPHANVGVDELSPSLRGEALPELPILTTPDLSMPFDLTPQSEFSTEESLLQESKLLIQDSIQLRDLWRQICDADMGVETQTLRIRLRTYQNCIVGKELVDWLIEKDKAAKRVQAMGIGQALLYAGYLECVGNQPPIFKDDFTLYRPGEIAANMDLQGDVDPIPTITEELEKNEPLWLQEIEKEEEDDDSILYDQSITMAESEVLKSTTSETDSRTLMYLSESSQMSNLSDTTKLHLFSRDMVEEPLPRQDSSVTGLGEDFLKGTLFLGKSCMPSSDVVTCPQGWRLVEQLREENGEKIAYERLKIAHSEHWHILTRQLLSQNGLLPSWEPVISCCINKITHFVRPDVRLEGDDMDIRNYVHVKKIPGGQKNDTNLVHGVIFTKNIAHKKMKTKIANPLILLLRGTIEFQRVEQKFSSLEPQILQEKEFMRNCIMKMIAYHPNVVVVEKSVSRLAQEFLLENGITLLYNVKLSVMERLARFTQADIIPSIDGLVRKPKMGFCHDFRCQTYTLPNKETKTLAVFDGCATHLGCTMVLTGGSANELKRVKSILNFMTYTAYNSLLELCFCMDEFALPQPPADELIHSFGSPEAPLNSLVDEPAASKTLGSEDQTPLQAKANEESDKKKTVSCNSSSVVNTDNMAERQGVTPQAMQDSNNPSVQLKCSVIEEDAIPSETESADSPKTTTKDSENDAGDERGKNATQSSVPASTEDKPVSKKPNPITVPLLNDDADFKGPASPLLSVPHGLKKRHPSGMSVASTGHLSSNTSGRSTPDLLLGQMSSKESPVMESSHLIGNIVCVLPLSEEVVNPGNKKESATAEIQDGVTSATSNNAVPEHQVNLGGEENGSQPGERAEENGLKSGKSSTSSLTSNTTSNMGSKKDNGSSSTALAKRDSSSRTLTSQLTELTDFSDPLLSYQNTQDESIFDSHRTSKIALKEIKQTKYKRFRKALDGVHLSISPYHKYHVPFIETEKGLSCNSRQYLPGEIYWSTLFEGERERKPNKPKGCDSETQGKKSNKETIEILSYHPLVTCNLTEPVWESNTQSILADFRARGGRIRVTGKPNAQQNSRVGETVNTKKVEEPNTEKASGHMLWEKKMDCLDPANHQRLMVLFSSFSLKSSNHPYPCVYPWVVTMEFYGRNDITLGGFLERFCFRKQYACPSPSCDAPMTDHIRRFVHGDACINVLLRKLDNEWPSCKDNILMWSWCRKCKMVTPVVPISADTWSLSFAKYLDLRFHSSSLMRRGSAEPCPHSLHHDHFQYFCFRDVVASFKYTTITLKELALPSHVVKVKPPVFDSVALFKKVSRITYRATDRYSLIFENTMKLKNEMTSETQSKILTEFSAEQRADKTRFHDTASNIQIKIQELTERVKKALEAGHTEKDFTFLLFSIEDNIKLLQRLICEDVIKWNSKIQEFVTSQQKKARSLPTRKEKDSGSVDELEKSIKVPAVSSKLTMQSSTTVRSNSMKDTDAAEQQSQEDKVTTGTSASLSSENNLSGSKITSIQDDEAPGTSSNKPPSPQSGLAPSQPDSSGLTSTASSAPASPLPQTTNACVVAESNEDSQDGWLNDLKGVTRRLLNPSSFTPLTLPFEQSEHYTLPYCEKIPVVVYDQEPSSIIAYALSSTDYLHRLKEIQAVARQGSPDTINAGSQSNHASSKDSANSTLAHGDATHEPGRKTGVLSFLRGMSRDSSANHQHPSSNLDSVHYSPKSDLEESVSITDDINSGSGLEDSTLSPEEKTKASGASTNSLHIELQFSDTSAKFYCRIYFAEQFRKLRKLILPGGENIFIRSLSRCKPWDAKGGKSGSSFSKTDDDRFILKQMSTIELESFEKFGPQYFSYIKSSFAEQRPTALAKILGVFRIGFRNSQTNSALRQDVLVMENLFYDRKITQKFDLKGSMRNRLVSTSGRVSMEELVLLDENLLKSSVENPVYLRPHSKAVLKAAITSDSAFLSTNLVMDYSLLVGIDESTGEMAVGIIDYIRTFTWDKRLEMVVKRAGILGGQGRMPTVVSPQLYRSRFLEAMDHYFLHVPSYWTGLGMDTVVQHL